MIVEESSKPKIPSVIEEKSSDQPIVSQLSIIPSSSADHGKITKPAPTIFKPHPPTGNPPSQIKIDSKPEAAKTPSDEEAKKSSKLIYNRLKLLPDHLQPSKPHLAESCQLLPKALKKIQKQ